MSSRNGVKKRAYRKRSSLSIKNRRTSQNNLICNSLKDFRGFHVVPRVVLKRYDITPYLCKQHQINKSEQLQQKELLEKSVHSRRLEQICVVTLIKENLEKLRSEYLNRRNHKISLDSTSNVENNTTDIFKCKFCDKSYNNEKKLKKHQEKKHTIVYESYNKTPKRVSFSDHVIIHEVKEYHKCRKCLQIFEEYDLLKQHIKQSHKKCKCNICSYCDKRFADRTFFKLHTKLHCNLCGKLFSNKINVIKHRETCRKSKLLTCKICAETYFSFTDLEIHNYGHTNHMYICNECNSQFETKCLLAYHIIFLHSNNRPKYLYTICNFGNKRLYLCNFCDETLAEQSLIELHLKSLPDLINKIRTYFKVYYFCDQCLKKFDTEPDMLRHKWSHYLYTNKNHEQENVLIKKYLNNNGIEEFKELKVVLEKVNTSEYILTGAVKSVDSKNNNQISSNNVIIAMDDQTTTKIIDESKKSKKIVNEQKMSETTIDRTKVMLKTMNEQKAIVIIPEIDGVKPKPRNTITSKHQCQSCGKYYSRNYCLKRHMEKVHGNHENLKCNMCEEIFVWPSLLKTHKCIRLKIPEMPFQDSRPEIHFDNLIEMEQNSFENHNYTNSSDFEILEPIINLRQTDEIIQRNHDRFAPLSNLGYKIITQQEVPIEF